MKQNSCMRPLLAATSALALLLGGCGPDDGGGGTSSATPGATGEEPAAVGLLKAITTLEPLTDTAPFTFGTQTHFSQGWGTNSITMAQQVKAPVLRDSVPWASVEKTAGTYDFSGTAASRIASVCAAGMKVILAIDPRNPLYDSGFTVSTPTGMTALTGYMNATLGRFGPCVVAVEIGNEINAAGLKYPTGTDATAAYIALLTTIKADVKPRFPAVAVLGGSTNMVGTGYLAGLFAAGMLPLVDGIAIHPYRSQAHSVDLELANLATVMRTYGATVPVWATEFSHDVPDSPFAAGELVKMAVLLSSSGVRHASWYALLDQTSFPNMGLYAGTTMKATGRAFRFVQDTLIPYGRPTKLSFADPLFSAWRYSDGRLVVWGSPRTITLSGSGQVFDAQGNALPAGTTAQVGWSPIVIVGASIQSAGTSNLVADTLPGYNTNQWDQFAQAPDGTYKSLTLTDDTFTSYFQNRYYKPMRVTMGGGAAAGTGTSPIRAVWRYTSDAAREVDVWGCFSKTLAGDGVDWTIARNGAAVARGVLTTTANVGPVPVTLAQGDRLEILFGPNQTSGSDGFSQRTQVWKRGTGSAVACP